MSIVFRQLCHILIKKQPKMDAELPKVILAVDNDWGEETLLYTLSASYSGCLLPKLWSVVIHVQMRLFGDTAVQVAFIFLQ